MISLVAQLVRPFQMCVQTSLALLVAAGCQSISFEPAPVVPTKNRLAQSARLTLTDLGAYTVDPGATMLADPNLQNRVTGQVASLTQDKRRWERAVAEYLSARRTFRSVVTEGQAELELPVRLTIYIDPSLGFKFDTMYVARAEAQLFEQGQLRPIGEFTGFGKAAGGVRRSGPRDDEGPTNQAVQAALNDLFAKLESDKRIQVLMATPASR